MQRRHRLTVAHIASAQTDGTGLKAMLVHDVDLGGGGHNSTCHMSVQTLCANQTFFDMENIFQLDWHFGGEEEAGHHTGMGRDESIDDRARDIKYPYRPRGAPWVVVYVGGSRTCRLQNLDNSEPSCN